jgi:hypothetical protein
MTNSLCGRLLAILVAGLPWGVLAQAPGPGSNPMDRFSKFFNTISFSAKAAVTVTGTAKKVPTMEFDLAVSEGRSRTEIDMGKMMAEAGGRGAPDMGKMISIFIPSKKISYQIMPAMNGYCEMAIPEAARGGDANAPNVDRKVLGTETVEGYECSKVLNTVTAKDGTKHVATTWEAAKLGGIPVRIETKTSEGLMTMSFKDIKTAKPPDSMFEPPAGLTKYPSMQAMMMQGMMKMMPQ